MLGIVFMLVAAGIVTVPAVLFIPHVRQSPIFNRVLWGATWLIAFLSAVVAPSLIGLDSPLNALRLDQTPVISTILGAVVGACSINAILWLMDRFDRSLLEEEWVDEPSASESEGDSDSESPQPR